MSAQMPGVQLARTVTSAAALGFVPVAIKLGLFDLLVEIGKPARGKEVLMVYEKSACSDRQSMPCLQLIDDTLYALAGLGFVDMTVDSVWSANDITRHLVHTPSAEHGALHFGGYQYLFEELQTPLQFAYQKMGNDELAQQHTYNIMAAEGRMDSFNRFMVGKFMKTATASERLARLGYHLKSLLQDAKSRRVIAMVDIGGGRGEMMLEFKQAFADLRDKDLVVQEFNHEISEFPGLTLSI
ncbi:hypothetical protein ASPACDRAFT_48452 [Aspergillus aculeatus ATCC 16872]|uniref:O-methyltransferase domain-containing protein n=1 Tax=Aspergillus aculeatus (strain ATCC 16872 / CBS 172.66 / WB 5094) TaxID=690307 RepID=A0A1L9WFR2_ASPA1|nr:uncharacterized protein ASPACDRAFT_48452 [Aspergillus aculeatus ATCC 16872]OJJ95004.1 hypothetical protein ASPACDRAFT_48452 [Aspergillus aculeatus ATCC 16872]